MTFVNNIAVGVWENYAPQGGDADLSPTWILCASTVEKNPAGASLAESRQIYYGWSAAKRTFHKLDAAVFQNGDAHIRWLRQGAAGIYGLISTGSPVLSSKSAKDVVFGDMFLVLLDEVSASNGDSDSLTADRIDPVPYKSSQSSAFKMGQIFRVTRLSAIPLPTILGAKRPSAAAGYPLSLLLSHLLLYDAAEIMNAHAKLSASNSVISAKERSMWRLASLYLRGNLDTNIPSRATEQSYNRCLSLYTAFDFDLGQTLQQQIGGGRPQQNGRKPSNLYYQFNVAASVDHKAGDSTTPQLGLRPVTAKPSLQLVVPVIRGIVLTKQMEKDGLTVALLSRQSPFGGGCKRYHRRGLSGVWGKADGSGELSQPQHGYPANWVVSEQVLFTAPAGRTPSSQMKLSSVVISRGSVPLSFWSQIPCSLRYKPSIYHFRAPKTEDVYASSIFEDALVLSSSVAVADEGSKESQNNDQASLSSNIFALNLLHKPNSVTEQSKSTKEDGAITKIDEKGLCKLYTENAISLEQKQRNTERFSYFYSALDLNTVMPKQKPVNILLRTIKESLLGSEKKVQGEQPSQSPYNEVTRNLVSSVFQNASSVNTQDSISIDEAAALQHGMFLATGPLHMEGEEEHKKQDQGIIVQSTQKGLIRVNCLDVCDRTNIGQALLAIYFATGQLKAVAPVEESPELNITLRQLWVHHGHCISNHYTSANTIKSEFVYDFTDRVHTCGRRTVKGMWDDLLTGFTRWYYNTVASDGQAQDAGTLMSTPCTVIPPSPLAGWQDFLIAPNTKQSAVDKKKDHQVMTAFTASLALSFYLHTSSEVFANYPRLAAGALALNLILLALVVGRVSVSRAARLNRSLLRSVAPF